MEKPLKGLKPLEKADWLFGARMRYDLPKTRKKEVWKFRGILISKDDNIIPDFKYPSKLLSIIWDESTIKDWYVNRNINQLSYDEIYTYG